MNIHTPSPRRPPFRTQDSNAAWAAAEGLLPIPDGFSAPGYVPANVVGGITYTVRSPQALSPQMHRPTAPPASVGRQLFAEFTGMPFQANGEQRYVPQEPVLQQQRASQPRATSFLPQQIASQEIVPPQRSSQHIHLQQQQVASPGPVHGIDLPQQSTSEGFHLQQQQAPSHGVRSFILLVYAHILIKTQPSQGVYLPQQLTSQGFLLQQQQATSQDVRLFFTFLYTLFTHTLMIYRLRKEFTLRSNQLQTQPGRRSCPHICTGSQTYTPTNSRMTHRGRRPPPWLGMGHWDSKVSSHQLQVL